LSSQRPAELHIQAVNDNFLDLQGCLLSQIPVKDVLSIALGITAPNRLQAEDVEPKMVVGQGGWQEASLAESGEGQARVEEQRVGSSGGGMQKQGKATKYDSIDPLAEQPSKQGTELGEGVHCL